VYNGVYCDERGIGEGLGGGPETIGAVGKGCWRGLKDEMRPILPSLGMVSHPYWYKDFYFPSTPFTDVTVVTTASVTETVGKTHMVTLTIPTTDITKISANYH
jgi:hypothetical protein